MVGQASERAESDEGHARRLSILTWVLAAGILSTGLHYSHNFVEVDRYPTGAVSGPAVRAAILIFWPLLTAIGLYGYAQYRQRRHGVAHAALLVYSLAGLSTLGHFLAGSPDVGAVWHATIYTDGLTGLAVVVFALYSMRAAARQPPPAVAA